jgi:hypothetical protein
MVFTRSTKDHKELDMFVIDAKNHFFRTLNVELILPNQPNYYTLVELDFSGYVALAYWAPL